MAEGFREWHYELVGVKFLAHMRISPQLSERKT